MSFKPVIAVSLSFVLTACVVITVSPEAGVRARPWPASASCPVPPDQQAKAEQLLALMNVERAKVGAQPLELSAQASAVAHSYACEIAARQDIDHTGTDGSHLPERLKRGGVSAGLMAENTGAEFTTPERGMVLWMASPGHKRNILMKGVSKVGIGVADGAFPTWVVDFYAPY